MDTDIGGGFGKAVLIAVVAGIVSALVGLVLPSVLRSEFIKGVFGGIGRGVGEQAVEAVLEGKPSSAIDREIDRLRKENERLRGDGRPDESIVERWK